TTVLVNDSVNFGGSTFLFRLREETGASYEEIVRAHTTARGIFGLGPIWADIEGLDNQVPARVQTKMRLHSRRLIERATRWLLNNCRQPLDIAQTIEVFRERAAEVWAALPKLLRGSDAEWFTTVHDELAGAGVPGELATRTAGPSSTSRRSTTTSATGWASRTCWTGSSNCRAATAGRPWPARPSGRTCSPRTPRSPRTCCAGARRATPRRRATTRGRSTTRRWSTGPAPASTT